MAKQERLQKELNRRQIARREKEKKLNQILIWSAIGVVALVVLIIGYGLVTELVVKARKPVARADGSAITTQEYQSRLYYQRLLMRKQLESYQSYLLQIDPNDQTMQDLYQQLQLTASNLESQLSDTMATSFGKQVLDTMLEERLVQKEAQTRNLTVNQDDVTLSIEQMLGYDRTVTETVTDTTTIQSFDTLYQSFRDTILKESDLSEEDYRAMVETSLLRDQLLAIIGEDVVQTSDQVETTFFTADGEEAAQTLRDRINNGEDTAALIEELNNDDSDLTAGYSLSWLPIGYLSSQLGATTEQVAFNTPIGKASEPTLGNDGKYYVIYVSGHEERPLDETMLQQAREQKYTDWLTQQEAERCEYLDWQDAVLTAP